MVQKAVCATCIPGTNRICQRLEIVPSRVHFSGEKAVFEVGRDKNPNFREAKREGGKRRFGGFAGFRHQNKKKTNANFVSKLAIRGAFVRLKYSKWQIAQYVSFGDGNIEYDFFVAVSPFPVSKNARGSMSTPRCEVLFRISRLLRQFWLTGPLYNQSERNRYSTHQGRPHRPTLRSQPGSRSFRHPRCRCQLCSP